MMFVPARHPSKDFQALQPNKSKFQTTPLFLALLLPVLFLCDNSFSASPVSVSVDTIYVLDIIQSGQKQYQTSGSIYEVQYVVIYGNVNKTESEQMDGIFIQDTARFDIMGYFREYEVYKIKWKFKDIYAIDRKQINDIAVKQIDYLRREALAILTERKSKS